MTDSIGAAQVETPPAEEEKRPTAVKSTRLEALRQSGMQEEALSSNETGRLSQVSETSTIRSNPRHASARISGGIDGELPPIPGTRRLGARKPSQAYKRPSILNLDDSITSLPLNSPHLRPRSLKADAALSPLASPRARTNSPRSRLITSPSVRTYQPSPLARSQNIFASSDSPYQVWNAEAYKIKRQEAQLALQIIPKFTEALSKAGPRPEFESIMRQSIEMHLDDEYDAAMIEIINQRILSRALLAWRAAAKTSAVNFRKQMMKKPPSFCSKLELLAKEPPRLQYRALRSKEPSQPVRLRKDSSATTDATRPSAADEDEAGRATEHPLQMNEDSRSDDHSPHQNDNSDAQPESTESSVLDAQIMHMYIEAAKAEEQAMTKRTHSSRRFGKLVTAFGRVASFRAPKN